MPLDAAGRKKRAAKAAKCLAKIRADAVKGRDNDVYLAYLYLTGASQKKTDIEKAVKFLLDNNVSPSLKKQDQTPYRVLADCTGLTRQRIYQIVKKRLNHT